MSKYIEHTVYIKSISITDTGVSPVLRIDVEYKGLGIVETITQSAYKMERTQLISLIRRKIKLRASELYKVPTSKIRITPKLENLIS